MDRKGGIQKKVPKISSGATVSRAPVLRPTSKASKIPLQIRVPKPKGSNGLVSGKSAIAKDGKARSLLCGLSLERKVELLKTQVSITELRAPYYPTKSICTFYRQHTDRCPLLPPGSNGFNSLVLPSLFKCFFICFRFTIII